MDERADLPHMPKGAPEEAARLREALERIAGCPQHRFPNPSLLAKYLQNIAVQSLGTNRIPVDTGALVQKTVRVRHQQLHLRKLPDHSLEVMNAMLRMGDLVAVMLCAEYMKRYEGCRIVFQLMDETHRCMKADVLFRNTIDEVITDEGADFGLMDPSLPEIYDPGPLWVASTFYHQQFGGRVVPRLCLDPAHYGGPEMDWGEYVLFHPLFDPPYNTARGMDTAFVNDLCDRLHAAFGQRAVVITNQPERISSGIRKVVSENLYDLIFLAGKAKVYLGGDTGFSHMAAAARVKHLFALYGANYFHDFATAVTEMCNSELVHPFAAIGKYWGAPMDTRPKCDPDATAMHFHVLRDNGLSSPELDGIIQQIRGFLAE